MSALSPRLFDRRYADLVELGRARLRALAPGWTDYNAHDPGITLMELLAWVAEAQMYALGHMRRDERAAYAALFGVSAAGTRAAHGLLWPDPLDPASPSQTFAESLVIEPDFVVHVENDDAIMFRPGYRVLWVPGRVVRLWTRLPDGTVRDHTAVNARSSTPFLPFGDTAGPRTLLVLDYATRGDAGLFPSPRNAADEAYFVLGVRVAPPASAADTESEEIADCGPDALDVALVAEGTRFPVRVVADQTRGMLVTGALVLDLSQVEGSPLRFSLEIKPARGLARAPRVARIEPNVLPITQRSTVVDRKITGNGSPDFAFELGIPGLCFEPGEPAIRIDVTEGTESRTWSRCERLVEQDPDALKFEFDEATDRVTFGNGINGRRLPADADVVVEYAVSDGDEGNLARNRRWVVMGIAGVFGVNPEPISGGRDRLDPTGLRREARRRSREEHALVSGGDIEDAAKRLPLLDVARAWIAPRPATAPATGEVTLVVMRRRSGPDEPAEAPETPRWVESVRRRLAPRLPLGSRLVVTAPAYVTFRVRAAMVVERGIDPAAIEQKAKDVLGQKLALVSTEETTNVRLPGVPLTSRDVTAWLRGIEGVASVSKVELIAGRAASDVVRVSPNALPRLDLEGSEIAAMRAGERKPG